MREKSGSDGPLVFLSYAREDSVAATSLCRELRARNRRVWFDKDSIRGGERWRSAVQRAIQEADFFVALLSDVSVSKRGTVQAEIKKALEVLEDLPEDKIYLIPVRLTPCSPTYSRLRELQWIDLFPSWDDALERLVLATEPKPGEADESGPATPFADVSILTREASLERPEVLRASDLVRQATGAIESYATARGIELKVRDEAPAARVRVPQTLVLHALTNVLHNALKYSFTSRTHKTSVEVQSFLESDYVRVVVTNVGLGIDPSEIEHVFQRGYRGREATREHQGMGLGLWAARSFLERGSGSIRIDSRPVRERRPSESTPYLTRVTIQLPVYRIEVVKTTAGQQGAPADRARRGS